MNSTPFYSIFIANMNLSGLRSIAWGLFSKIPLSFTWSSDLLRNVSIYYYNNNYKNSMKVGIYNSVVIIDWTNYFYHKNQLTLKLNVYMFADPLGLIFLNHWLINN